jgi:hypothetical protein
MSEFVEVKTQDLLGAALDWSVAKAEGFEPMLFPMSRTEVAISQGRRPDGSFSARACSYSTDWRQGGPLIVSRGVSIRCIAPLNAWEADCWDDSVVPSRYCQSEAETPLISACRAIVSSVLGDTVSVPKELMS